MTTRREVFFEYESSIDKPPKAEIEILSGRAALLAYLTPFELSQCIQDNTAIIEERENSIPISVVPSIHSLPLSNIISPLLQIIQGSIIILRNGQTGCQLYVFQVFDELWISFRGTQLKAIDSLRKDILTDMKIQLRKTDYLPPDNEVHTGFNESYMSVRKELQVEIDKRLVSRRELKIRFVGHSLGGALATLAAVDIKLNMNPNLLLVRSFGCPCVGNEAFVKNFNTLISNSLRYVIYLDPVPIILSEIQPLGYKHVNEKIEMREMKSKHNIRYYIKILCQWAKIEDDVDDDIHEGVVEEEVIFNKLSEHKNINVLVAGISLLLLSGFLYRKYNYNVKF